LFSSENLALSAGIIVRPFSDWWFALSYVSPPGVISALSIEGPADVITAPRIGGALVTGRAEVTLQMPQSVHVGARGTLFPGYDFTGALRWQNYSRQNEFDIRLFGPALAETDDVPEWYPRFRGFRDVWRIQAGLEAQEGARVRLGGRVRVETGATSAQTTTPLQVHPLLIGLAGGMEIRLTESIILSTGYDFSWYPEVGGDDSGFDPRDRVACVDSNFDFNQCAAAREGRALPTAAGTYRRMGHALSFSIRYDRL
jgi:hypothetical protein